MDHAIASKTIFMWYYRDKNCTFSIFAYKDSYFLRYIQLQEWLVTRAVASKQIIIYQAISKYSFGNFFL